MRRIVLVVFAALVLVACGGDDDSAGSGDGSEQAVESGDDAEPSDDPAADDPPADSEGGAAGDDASGEAVSTNGPSVGDHWHAAYGIYLCDSFVAPLQDQSDPEGIHSHGDGVIHIHPFVESAANENATLGKFFEAVSVEFNDDGFFGAGGTLEVGDFDCGGEIAELKVARWSLYRLDEEPAIVETSVADIRFVEDLEIYTIGFVAPGTELPLPPTIASLGTLSDVDPEDIPELPAGFSVASVDPPPAGESISGETPCPAEDGSSPRTTSFSQAPPMCIDPDKSYTATFVTNFGDVVVELDTEATPETVNNFVVLARYGYYDDTALFRTAPSIAIIQGGAPNTNSPSDPGPGYTIADEADGFSYVPGDLAMARTPAPDSASAQFFFSAGPATANLDGEPGNPDGSGRGTYVVFGRTVQGLDVLEEILSLHIDDAALAGGGPSQAVVIETVVISES